MKRGPRSAADLTVIKLDAVRPRARIPCPRTLTGAPRSLFIDLVANFPHLKVGDTALLCEYVSALVTASKLAKKTDKDLVKSWEIKTRTALAIARSLRLTQISQTHPETFSRARQNAKPVSYYDQMRSESDDD